MLQLSDDGVHYPTGGESGEWRETFAFACYDPEPRIGVVAMVTRLPNAEKAIGRVFIVSGGQRILMTTDEVILDPRSEEVRVGAIVLEPIKPMSSWRIRFKGSTITVRDSKLLLTPHKLFSGHPQLEQVDLDLVFTAMNTPFQFFNPETPLPIGVTAQGAAKGVSFMGTHYEQVGACEGHLRVGGSHYDVHAFGDRYHYWGGKDWRTFQEMQSYCVLFGHDASLCLTKVKVGGLESYSGYLYRAGANYAIRNFDAELTLDRDGKMHQTVVLAAVDDTGEEVAALGEVLTHLPILKPTPEGRALLTEALTEYKWKGYRGFGFSRFMKPLPRDAVSLTTENLV
ncbi:MAG: hypothetical protein K8I02_05125 [Candidatus Methylomirabilis sp.]|nr:hypothetical protein [Deltaproteobacteria bacterium]